MFPIMPVTFLKNVFTWDLQVTEAEIWLFMFARELRMFATSVSERLGDCDRRTLQAPRSLE